MKILTRSIYSVFALSLLLSGSLQAAEVFKCDVQYAETDEDTGVILKMATYYSNTEALESKDETETLSVEYEDENVFLSAKLKRNEIVGPMDGGDLNKSGKDDISVELTLLDTERTVRFSNAERVGAGRTQLSISGVFDEPRDGSKTPEPNDLHVTCSTFNHR